MLDAVTLWTARLGGVLAAAMVLSAALRTPGRLLEPGYLGMLASFAGVVALRRWQSLAYRWRALAFCGLVFCTGATALHSLGVLPGPTLVCAFVVIAARLFLGRRAMLVALLLTGAAVVSAGMAHPAPVAWADAQPLGGWFWLRFALGYAMPTGCIAVLVAHVVDQIERSLSATAQALQRSSLAEAERERSQRELARAEVALERSQKLEAVGRLAAGVGHDFNNLLQVILSWASMLEDEPDPKLFAEGLDAIQQAALQGSELTQRLLEFGRRDVRAPALVSAATLVNDGARSLRRLLPEDIEVLLDLDERAPPLLVDPNQLGHVLLNLGVNARDAMPGGGQLRVSVSRVAASELPDGVALAASELVRISVQDDGAGMSPETLSHLFEPFYTTKGEHGTGLGLATSRSLVQRNRGAIRVESELGKGTSVHLYFPAQRPEAPGAVEPSRAEPLRAGQGVVMIAEDDAGVRRVMVHALESAGYEVLESADASSAIALLERRGADVDVLCTDGIMPGGGTRQLVERFLARRPGGQVIVCSGYVREELLRRDLDAGALAYLPKPFHTRELLARIAQLLERARPDRAEPS